MLDHIHIENFRLFKTLDIPNIGQVNLITGKNNTGKTTVLEALRLFANRNSLPHFESTFQDILRRRGDLRSEPYMGFDAVFFKKKASERIVINDSLKIAFNLQSRELTFGLGENGVSFFPRYFSQDHEFQQDLSYYIPVAFSLDNARLWKKIELTDKEDQVAEVLRIIEPDIVRVSINEMENSAKVRLKNSSTPVPLKNFGEGMNRLLAIALGLVSAENDVLLIDEIDLGLHHSVQPLMWEIVFQTAKKLNVQVIATTHSSDCVRAFAEIAGKPEYVGMGNYLRLQKSASDEGLVVVDYDMEELETALELNIETR
ncbi:MAG: AAA family ATPase [Saprospiraceae bacterium]